MNRIINTILAVIILFNIGCKNTETTEKKDSAVIAGRIAGSDAKAVYLELNYLDKEQSDSTSLDNAGNFSLKINVKTPSYFMLYNGKNKTMLYITPGDSIYINAKSDDFENSLNFAGIGAENNNYLVGKNLLKESLSSNDYDLFRLEPEAFVLKTDSILNELKKYLDKKITSESDFKNIESKSLEFYIAFLKLQYPSYYKYFSKQESVNLPANFKDAAKKLNLNDSVMLQSPEFITYLENYFQSEAYETNPDKENANETELTLSAMNSLVKQISSAPVKEYLLYKFLKDHITYFGMDEDFSKLKAVFEPNCGNKEYNETISKAVAEWESIAKGKPAPDFNYPDIDSNFYSLSQFKGKYVYIDVWATWCGPCKAEIPYYEELKQEFKNKNVVFMSISVDDSKDSWKAMVKDKKLSPLQLYAGGWSSDIAKKYLIHSIPRFILIDNKGNILNANADRPSGKIKDILNALEGI